MIIFTCNNGHAQEICRSDFANDYDYFKAIMTIKSGLTTTSYIRPPTLSVLNKLASMPSDRLTMSRTFDRGVRHVNQKQYNGGTKSIV